jgi:hypothetical protein
MSNENATESASGSIFFELDLKLTSDSGRAKHLDVNEQGDWIAECSKNPCLKWIQKI